MFDHEKPACQYDFIREIFIREQAKLTATLPVIEAQTACFRNSVAKNSTADAAFEALGTAAKREVNYSL